MKKDEFLSRLGKLLRRLPPEDRERSLHYYAEMVEDSLDDGMDEEQAVAAIGTPEEVAAQILEEIPLPAKHRMSATEIVLLVVGSPLWLALGAALAAVLVSLYAVLASLLIGYYALLLACGAGALGGLAWGVFGLLHGRVAMALLYIGAALICLSLTAVLAVLLVPVTRAFVRAALAFPRWLRAKWEKKRGISR